MSELNRIYENYLTDELLNKRSLGFDGLNIDVHKVIEQFLHNVTRTFC